jgi:hypothetical protein
MAKWIKETFPLEMPDFYLSQERTLGLVEDWMYEGPRRVAVFVHRKTNFISYSHGWFNITDKKDKEVREKEWEDLSILAGLDFYPAEVTFEKDRLLLAAVFQRHVLQEDVPLQKEYYEDGLFSIHPTDVDYYSELKFGKRKIETERDWIYCHSWPTTPLLTIEIAEVRYDPDKGEWIKPYQWKRPHIQTHEFAYFYYQSVKDIEDYIKNEMDDDSPEFIEKILDYRDKLKQVQEKYKNYYDKPWMILVPPDPRRNEPAWKNYENWVVYGINGEPMAVSTRMLGEMADDVNMNIPLGMYPKEGVTPTILPY